MLGSAGLWQRSAGIFRSSEHVWVDGVGPAITVIEIPQPARMS